MVQADLQGIELTGMETCLMRHRYPVVITVRVEDSHLRVRVVDPGECPVCKTLERMYGNMGRPS